MRNYVEVNFDLYIHVSDLNKLDQGEAVIGYKEVSNLDEYELVNKDAFLPAIKINENEYSVCTINE